MKSISANVFIILLLSWLTMACSNTPQAPQKPVSINDLRTSSTTVIPNTGGAQSEIPGQLNDGGWVVNVPGQPHTHNVVLSACPDRAIVTTHVHEHDKSTPGEHKHNGCFVCPPA